MSGWFEQRLIVLLLWLSTAVAFAAHISSERSERHLAAAAVSAGLVMWLHVVHRTHRWGADDEGSTQSLVAIVGLLIAFGVLVTLDASYLLMLFGVFTFTFGFGGSVRRAAVLSGVLTVGWIVAWLYHDLPSGAIATPLFVWATANAVHVLSTRIATQNAERGVLIDRLERTRNDLAIAERERGVLEERNRFAREIHDTLAQGFTSIVLVSEATANQLQSLPSDRVTSSLELIASTARENLAEARGLVAAQPPVALEDRSLGQALRSVGDDVARRTGAVVEVHAEEGASFGGAEDVALLRVAQEATGNIVKHAEASSVFIELRADEDFAVLRVVDDGIGFDSSTGADPTEDELSNGDGLGFMADRVHELGGAMTIDSKPDQGTAVEVRIPVTERVL